jgi:hydroxyacylglutathione hydrolase
VLVTGFPAGPPGTNCFVVAPGPGGRCVVIDPGIGAADPLDRVLDQHRLTPAAVLLTHGHLDHTFSVLPVCGAKGIPAYIHPDDRAQLTDPLTWIGVPAGTPVMGLTSLPIGEPDDLRTMADGDTLDLAGISLGVRHAPGHTLGSVVFTLDAPDAPLLFSGDLLFAGSIGRVDLPGGSYQAMLDSLARVVLPMDDETVVHPGHGGSSTIGRERRTNPYLQIVKEQTT